MKQELNCKIVQDLMQSYLDEVTSEYTREQMEEHMNHCKECSDYRDKLKLYEKLRADDAEYMRAWHRKVQKWTTISVVSILIISSILLYLFIPRKITYDGSYTELVTTAASDTTEVKITFSYIPGLELFGDEITRKMNAKVVVQDSYNEIIWQRNLKNWYYYLPTDGHKSFANTMFFYYYEDTNQMELANLFFDEEKSEFLILAEYFEIEACTKEFREKVESVMNIHYD